MAEISVIVPVYNAEKFLDNCIKSILAQSFSDFELILVNDGSSDNSLEICLNYEKLDGRVTVINKENGGVSAARNTGLDNAKGKYISFIDSDDEICVNYLLLLLQNIKNADISIGSMKLLDINTSFVLSVPDKRYSLSDFKADAKNTFNSQCVNSPCNKLFKQEIIAKSFLRFRTDLKMGEDAVFVINYLEKCAFIKAFNDIIYIYHHGDEPGFKQRKSADAVILQNRIIMCKEFQRFFNSCGYVADILLLREYLSAITEDLKHNEEVTDKLKHFTSFIDKTGIEELINRVKVPFIKRLIAYEWLTLLKKRKYKKYLEKYAGLAPTE